MAKSPKEKAPEVDPRGGDEILKRMLKTKPKTHDEMVKGTKRQRGKLGKPDKRGDDA